METVFDLILQARVWDDNMADSPLLDPYMLGKYVQKKDIVYCIRIHNKFAYDLVIPKTPYQKR